MYVKVRRVLELIGKDKIRYVCRSCVRLPLSTTRTFLVPPCFRCLEMDEDIVGLDAHVDAMKGFSILSIHIQYSGDHRSKCADRATAADNSFD